MYCFYVAISKILTLSLRNCVTGFGNKDGPTILEAPWMCCFSPSAVVSDENFKWTLFWGWRRTTEL